MATYLSKDLVVDEEKFNTAARSSAECSEWVEIWRRNKSLLFESKSITLF